MAEDSFLEVDPGYRSVVLDWFPQLSQPKKDNAGGEHNNLKKDDVKTEESSHHRFQKQADKVPLPPPKEVKVRDTLDTIIRNKLKKKRKFEEEPEENTEYRDGKDEGGSKVSMVTASKKLKTNQERQEQLLEGRRKRKRRRKRKGGQDDNLSSKPEKNNDGTSKKMSVPGKEGQNKDQTGFSKTNHDTLGTNQSDKDEEKSANKQKKTQKRHKIKEIHESVTKSDSKTEKVITSRGFILSTASVVTKQPEQDKLKTKNSKKNKKKRSKDETEKESGKNYKNVKRQKKRENLEKDSDILHKKKVKKFKRLDKKCEKQEDISERDVSGSQSNLPMPVNQDGQKNKCSIALKKQNLKNDSTKNNNELNHATTIVKSTSQADTRNDREADQRQSNTNLSAPSQAGDVDVAIRPVKNFQEEINSHGTVTESVTLSSPTKQQWTPQKRKKKKSRSKQKNIRKDNRPDHLKPPHLRIKTDTHLPVLGL